LLHQEGLPDGQPWYVMLETVREFAQERLAESGEADAIQRRHILRYLKLVESAEQDVVGPQQGRWLFRIEQEHDNLRAALNCCVARGYAEPGFRLALALWWFWMVRGHLSEGRERFAALFARFPLREVTGRRAGDRAKALHPASTLASIQGDFAAARSLQEEGLAISRTLGDRVGAANALEGLVVIASMQGDGRAAREYADACLEIARAIGDQEMIGHALNASANVLHEQGEYVAARELAEESVAESREAGSPRQIVASYLTLAVVAQDLGDRDTAQSLSETALAYFRRFGDRRGEALALANLGSFAEARGDFATAQRRLGDSVAIQQELAD